MKPGDLVYIRDGDSLSDYFPHVYGIIVGFDGPNEYPVRVLTEGALRLCALWALHLVNETPPDEENEWK